MLMLRHTLAKAIIVAKPDMARKVLPSVRMYAPWETLVQEAVLCAFSRNMDGPEIDLLRRACRQMEQSETGLIQWDDPETPEEIALEEPYLEKIRAQNAEINRKATVSAKHFASKNILILTGKETKVLRDPEHTFSRLSKGNGVLSILQYVPPEIIHTPNSWGIVLNESSVNTMIRHGILELVQPGYRTRNASYAFVCTGPQYERALALYGIVPRPHNGITGPNLDYYLRVGRGELPPRFPHPRATQWAQTPKEWAEVLAKNPSPNLALTKS